MCKVSCLYLGVESLYATPENIARKRRIRVCCVCCVDAAGARANISYAAHDSLVECVRLVLKRAQRPRLSPVGARCCQLAPGTSRSIHRHKRTSQSRAFVLVASAQPGNNRTREARQTIPTSTCAHRPAQHQRRITETVVVSLPTANAFIGAEINLNKPFAVYACRRSCAPLVTCKDNGTSVASVPHDDEDACPATARRRVTVETPQHIITREFAARSMT